MTFQVPPNVKVFKHLHSSFRDTHPDFCRKSLIKDYIGGDLTNPELIPGIEDDPVLQQQCRNFGYMLIQMGDQVRQVYCGTGQAEQMGEKVKCPYCQEYYCPDHFAQHMGFDPFTAPEAYIQAPAADPRTEMSTWDNAELRRMLGERKAHEKLLKSLQPEGEHAISPEAMLTLPLDQRIQAEVWSYVDEYKSPPSVGDISVELETRGKDVAFQEATERYAHANDEWLPQFMEQMASQGLLDRTPEGWYLPPRGWTMKTLKHAPGQHDQSSHAGDRQRHESYMRQSDSDTASYLFSPKINERVRIKSPEIGHHGESGSVLYSRLAPGSKEEDRQYIIGLGQKDQYGNYPNKIMRTSAQLERELDPPSPTQADVATTPPAITPPTPAGMPPGAIDIRDLMPGGKYGKPKPGPTPYPDAPSDTSGYRMQPMFPVEGPGGRVRWIPFSRDAPKPVSAEGWEQTRGRVAMFGGAIHGKKDYFLQPAKIDGRAPKVEGLSIVNWEPYTKETSKYTTGRGPGSGVTFTHQGKEIHLKNGDTIKNVPVTEEVVRDWLKDIPPEERAGLRLNVNTGDNYEISKRLAREWVVEGGDKIRLREPDDSDRVDVISTKVGGSSTKASAQLGGAFYLSSHKTLYIGKQSEYSPQGASIKRILTHETGHHVQDNLLDYEESIKWDSHWGKNKSAFVENLGEYSGSESYEGFAEFYEKSKSDPGMLQEKMPQTWSLFQDMMKQLKKK